MSEKPAVYQTTKTLIDVPWNVIVYNDPVNYMGYVTWVLQQIFGYSKEKAEIMMMEIHNAGRSIVWSGEREKAELYAQQLQGKQLKTGIEKTDFS